MRQEAQKAWEPQRRTTAGGRSVKGCVVVRNKGWAGEQQEYLLCDQHCPTRCEVAAGVELLPARAVAVVDAGGSLPHDLEEVLLVADAQRLHQLAAHAALDLQTVRAGFEMTRVSK